MNLDRLFHQILKPALGCTEPVAVALASAAACQAAHGWTPNAGQILHELSAKAIRSIRVEVSKSIFKNGFAIAIPNADGHKGLLMSAALGIFCDPGKQLRLFADLQPNHIALAERMVSENRVRVEVKNDAGSGVFIRTEVELEEGSGACLIYREHANISCLWRNGQVVEGDPDCEQHGQGDSVELEQLKSISFSDLLGLLNDLPESVITLLRETKAKNVNACQIGIGRPMGVGAGYFGAGSKGPRNYTQHLSTLAAAGSDVRMSGYPVEIMSSAGSGNQGITATIPIVVYANAHFIDDDRMLKALAFSHLVTMYLTMHIGYLSAFCGVAIKAGMGAACGLTYLMGGEEEDIDRTVKIMAATLTGMICDGAKAGCALKVSTAAEMATQAAVLSMNRAEIPDDNGIIGSNADETIANLASLNRSMEPVDRDIIQIMLAKVAN
jgi:L-cysteine desulfidase